MIQVKLFADFRERVGTDSIHIEASEQLCVAGLLQQLAQRGEQWSFLNNENVLCAVNHTLCDANTSIHDGDEVAFFPPVTGG
ncbi:MoaD/ThiS family protein [Glaciecola siphonariae]|uniref:Molybdopterin synthase sulfur carrier subunit n=1 Tax=Glaciecola siphonariae TaxID=521012 RepID=A0ABV9LXT6_9ALTE